MNRRVEPPLMERYRGRPEAMAAVKANWRAWLRLREMSVRAVRPANLKRGDV